MSSLALTIPASLVLAGVLLALVIRAVRRGEFDDWEGPAARHHLDDDARPERPGERLDGDGYAPPPPSGR